MLPHSLSTKHENPAHLCPFFIPKGLASPGPAVPILSVSLSLAFVGFAFISFFCLLSTPSSLRSLLHPCPPLPPPPRTSPVPLCTYKAVRPVWEFLYRPRPPTPPLFTPCLLEHSFMAKSQQWLKKDSGPRLETASCLAGNGLGDLKSPHCRLQGCAK